MLGLLPWFHRARTPRRRTTFPRSTRLRLEQLETRDCPSTISFPSVQEGPFQVIAGQGSNNLQTATSLTLATQENGLKSVTLSGVVMADNSAFLRVQFSGAVNASTTTDSNGRYSLTVNADHLGQVQATVLDGLGQVAASATKTITVPPPDISDFDWEDQSGWFIFTGKVTHPDAAGMVITLQGAPQSFRNGIQVTVGSDGTFSYAIQLDGSAEQGSLAAKCTDCWGQQGIAITDVTQPTI